MPAARGNRERVLQIGRCLRNILPAPYPVDLICVRKIDVEDGCNDPIACITGDYGESWYEKGRIQIRIAVRPGIRRSAVIDTLLHEWAHALIVDRVTPTQAPHCARWARAYGRVYRWYVDADPSGAKISGNY